MEYYLYLVKRKLLVIVAIGLAVLLGWMIGYIRFPYVGYHDLYWLGFFTSLVLLAVGLALFRVLKRADNQSDKPKNQRSRLWLVLSLATILLAIFTALNIASQKRIARSESFIISKKIEAQEALIDSFLQENQGVLIAQLLDKIDMDLRMGQTNQLSEENLKLIEALNTSLKPYKSILNDTLSLSDLSPERGHLLLGLAWRNLDSSSWSKVKQRVSFAHADLTKANLSGLDLSGIDLSMANLHAANLSHTNLSSAKLSKANFHSAQLDSSDLSGAEMVRANLDWAEVNHAKLSDANLNGVYARNTKFVASALDSTTLQWSDLTGALFSQSNLVNADLMGAKLVKSDLSECKMQEAYLRHAVMTDAVMNNVDLYLAKIEKDWMGWINDWNVAGANDIHKRYLLVYDTAITKVKNDFRLVEKQ